MATAKKAPRASGALAEQAVALAWGAWTELGVSGWTATHHNWAVDPEPLIVFTAQLGDTDPRLRDEASDWCVRHWRYVSKSRLKNLLHRQPDAAQAAFGEFAATVGGHAGITWPGATTPRRYTPTGRSTLPPLERPSLVWLRMRSIFGLGARTEILRVFLAQPAVALSAVRLAELTGYTKRNIAEEGETLQRAGLLAVRTTGNRFEFTLARRPDLERFVGALPEHRPDWTAILNISRELVGLDHQAASGSPRTLPVKTRQMLRTIEGDLQNLDLAPPNVARQPGDLLPAIRTWGAERLASWAAGIWPTA
jgi:hypothetical protein